MNSEPSKRTIQQKVKEMGQAHLLRFRDDLNPEQKKQLALQIDDLDASLIQYFQATLRESRDDTSKVGDLQPADVLPIPSSETEQREHQEAFERGEKELQAGRIGAILVAGGQGTRLNFDGPKGTFPIGPVTDRTLFQYHFEKLVALERRYNTIIPFYIMTSTANNDETIAFLEKNSYFGKDPETVHCFVQRMLPAFTSDGNIFLADKDQLSLAPDGHGGLLHALKVNGMIDDMARRGVETLYYFQVDNPLLNICDPAFIGFHIGADAEMSAKTVYKKHPDEKLGVIGMRDGRYRVIEYSELSYDEKRETENGKLQYGQGSIAIHLFARSFLERLTAQTIELPYHLSHKKINYMDADGNYVEPEKPNGYKFEQFIFDALPEAESVVVMQTRRDRDFSPVKNLEGDDSPATAKRDLCNQFGDWLEECGYDAPRDDDNNVQLNIEISPLFADSAEQLTKKLPGNFTLSEEILLE